MKAWRVEQHGGPESTKLVEIQKPEPGPLQVRVRIEAVGLNHMDLWVRKGVPGHKFPLPLIPGCDIAGVVDAAPDAFGPGALEVCTRDGLLAGTPVIVSPTLSCGRCEACLSGYDPICAQFGLLGEHTNGGCTEFICVPVQNIITRPTGLSAEHAAALPVQFLTAWNMITRKAELRPGEIILIHAGGSGVSVAAIQIAKLFGATVITTVGSAEKAEHALALGADHAIQYREAKFREKLKGILPRYGKRSVDVVIDHVGEETFSESLKCLSWGGRLVTCGATSGSQITLDLKPVFFKNLSILGSTMGSKSDLIRIVNLVGQGKIKPVIDSVFPFDQYLDAVTRLESRAGFGKVILKIS